MQRRSSALIGGSTLIGAELLTRVVGPLLTLVVVGVLGAQEFGVYAAALAIVNIVSILPILGTEPALTRWMATGNARSRGLALGLTSTTILSLLGILVLVAWVLSQQSQDVRLTTLLMSGYVVGSGLTAVVNGIYQGEARFGSAAAYSAVSNGIVWGGVAIALVVGVQTAPIIGGVQSAAFLVVGLGGLFILLMSGERGALRFSGREAVRFSRDVGGFAATTSLSQVYNRADAALLASMSTPLQVGQYTIAYRGTELIFTIPALIFGKVLFAKFFAWKETASHRIRTYMYLTSNLFGAGGWIVFLIVFFLGPELIDLVLGPEHREAGELVRYLAWVIPLQFMAAPAGALLLTQGFVGQRLVVQGVTLVVNLMLNLILIPRFDAKGAAIAMVASSGIQYIGSVAMAVRHVPSLAVSPGSEAVGSLPAIVVGGLVIAYIVSGRPVPGLVAIAAGVAVAVWALARTRHDERLEIRRLFTKPDELPT